MANKEYRRGDSRPRYWRNGVLKHSKGISKIGLVSDLGANIRGEDHIHRGRVSQKVQLVTLKKGQRVT